jgi:hypothetical protein
MPESRSTSDERLTEVRLLVSDMRGELREHLARIDERQAGIADDVMHTRNTVKSAMDSFHNLRDAHLKMGGSIEKIELRLVPLEEAVEFWNKTIRKVALRSAAAGATAGGSIASIGTIMAAFIAKKLGLL